MTKLIRISVDHIIDTSGINSIELIQGERLREIGYNPEVKGVIRINVRESVDYSNHYDIICYSIEAFNNKINNLVEILEIKELK